jgi:hypothetical protein
MEEDYKKTPESVIRTPRLALKRLEAAIDTAQERIDYEAAHNSELLRALDTVKLFLKQKGRVCYGGTAMNAILPTKYQFYNPETDLPDYDFFSPKIESDVQDLLQMLRSKGFKDVYHRVGMHEGTKKILVNFTPIADISNLPPSIYNVFHRRAIVKEGVRYTDPDALRMMMYLELSRPKGEVARWEKVYERLQILNSVFPPRAIRDGQPTRKAKKAADTRGDHRKILQDFILESQRILISGRLLEFYTRVLSGKGAKPYEFPSHSGCLAFLSPEIHKDAEALKMYLGGPKVVKAIHHPSKGDIIPAYYELQVHDRPVALLFQETACHSFIPFQTTDGRSVSIASPDTLITLYYAILFFTNRAKHVMCGLNTTVPRLIQLVEKNRNSKRPAIPAFSLACKGYQKGYATLLREKVVRIQKEKEAAAAATGRATTAATSRNTSLD